MKRSDFDFSKPRVRLNGRVLDKCAMGSVIHELSSRYLSNYYDPYSIYWDLYSYKDMSFRLSYLVSLIPA